MKYRASRTAHEHPQAAIWTPWLPPSIVRRRKRRGRRRRWILLAPAVLFQRDVTPAAAPFDVGDFSGGE